MSAVDNLNRRRLQLFLNKIENKVLGRQVAQDIMGMQNKGKFTKIDNGGHDVPKGYCVVSVNYQLVPWIYRQAISQWKEVDTDDLWDRFVISDELYTLMALRWS